MKTDRARLYRWQIARAKEVDDSLRERAFLDVPETINGVVVVPLSPRRLNILFQIQSPFLYGGKVNMEDVGLFLWIVSPHYSQEVRYVVLPRRKLLWRRFKSFLRREPFIIPTVRQLFVSELVLHERFLQFHRAITRYIDRTFRDTPGQPGEGKPIATCYAANLVHKIAKTYGWPEDAILDMPLTRLFQYLKWVQIEEDPKAPQFNPMEEVVERRF